MVATTNKGLEKPARGSLSGVWDTPVNANMDIIDSSFGGVATISLLSTNVTLSTSQAQCAMIRLTGAITTSLIVTFPAIGSTWTIINDCTNLSSYYILAYNGSSAQYIGIPPGVTDIMGDGVYIKYRSLPPIGSYMMLAGNGYQPWMTVGSPQWPYLNCDGSAIPGAYTQLIQMIGANLPDLRGRCFFNTDQSTGRLAGVLGYAYTHAGGDQYLMSHAHSGSGSAAGSYATGYNLDHSHNVHVPVSNAGGGFSTGGSAAGFAPPYGATDVGSDGASYGVGDHTHTISVGVAAAGAGGWQNIPPAIIGGLTFIRAGA